MNNTFKDFKEYTSILDVNHYSWIKHLFTPATEMIFPKWSYYVPQNGTNKSTLLRCNERDIKSVPVVSFIWLDDSVTVVYEKTVRVIDIPLYESINNEYLMNILNDDGPAIINVIESALNPLMIS